MLEDRLKLKVHRENRELRGFNLVLASGGLRLKRALAPDGCGAEGR